MTPPDYPGKPDGSVEQVFGKNCPEDIPANTFEVGLILGGTVSAGAYTAGALDFLFEALEEWEKAKGEEDESNRRNGTATIKVPRHKVVIRVIAGTSGGGVNAIITARALRSRFPHVSILQPPQEREATGSQNPYYDVWVNRIDIKGLLKVSDLESGEIPSLLCSKLLDDIGEQVVRFGDDRGPARDYVTNPLPVILTYTNLGGVPYKQDFQAATPRPEYFVDHADFIRFACEVPAGTPHVQTIPPDAWRVGDAYGGHKVAWPAMVPYALGTAAFPFGLAPREIARSAEDYRYRWGWTESAAYVSKPEWLIPDWSRLVPAGPSALDKYAFWAVDGGCTDNEPIELARTWLAGPGKQNARGGIEAKRAIILIDPFTDPPEDPPKSKPGLLGILFPLLSSLIGQCRYSTADMSLFFARDVFSRYLMTAIRTNPDHPAGERLAGGEAIAGSRLNAFLGFMSRSYREHDYLLGRRNCQAFLSWEFSVPDGNPVFVRSSLPDLVPPRNGQASNERPLIPLLGLARQEQKEPEWPRGCFDPDELDAHLHVRVGGLLKALAGRLTKNPILRWGLAAVLGLVKPCAVAFVKGPIRKAISQSPSL